jgi:hypothetical protein
MKSMKSLAMIACLGLVAVGALSAQAAPLTVTLTLLNPCPIDVTQSLGLKAQVMGGNPSGETRYKFEAWSVGPRFVINEKTAEATISWVPTVPGSYHFGVTVQQTYGGVVTQTSTPMYGGASCEVKKATLQVGLTVSPPLGHAVAPPQSAAGRMTLSANVFRLLPNARTSYLFSVSNTSRSSNNTWGNTNFSVASWTPLDPPQPADPGIYVMYVGVSQWRPGPQGVDVIVAEGGGSIKNYQAMAPKAFGNVPLSKVDDQAIGKTPPPPPVGTPATSQVSLAVTPLSPGKTGNIAMTATVGVPGNPSGVTNKFVFSYVPSAGGQSATQTLQTSAASQSWTLSPQPAPGTYILSSVVETRRTADNALLAQGSGQIANYVVTSDPTSPYGWLFPVTTQNTTLAVGTKYGSATNTIAGNSIKDIVNNPGVRVRADNTACAQCHGGSFSKDGFCSSTSLFLSKGPHATSGQPADQTLGSLFTNWKGRNCPN